MVVLGFIQGFAALVLAVTLYAITREQDADLDILALACRVGEVGSHTLDDFLASAT